MAEIKQIDRRDVVDYMARDATSLLGSMRALIPDKLPEWQDYASEADFGNVLLELFAHMGDILSYYQDRVANESFLGTAQTRRSIIHHLRLIGYKLATAAPASTELTMTATVPADIDEIVIRKGDAFATKSQKDRPSVRFEYVREAPLVIDCRDLFLFSIGLGFADVLDERDGREVPDELREQFREHDEALTLQALVNVEQAGSNWTIVDIGKKYLIRRENQELNVYLSNKQVEAIISVEEGRLVREEILGTSDGTPNQRFTLARPRLILRSLEQGQAVIRDILLTTQVEGDTEIEVWTFQESLAFGREEQRDFAVEIDEEDRATIIFGDGAFGAIPPRGAVVKATYRVGGGPRGNVAAGTIQTIVDAPQLTLIGAQVTNREPATGGAERESIEHAVQHAPLVFRSRKRAVTAGDYETLARDFRGVGKVRAEATGWNTVKLFVAPAGGGYVSDVLRANLLAYFEDKRPVSTLVEIEDVDYLEVYVTAVIQVKAYYVPEEVREQVYKSADGLLAFENVDFAKPIYLSKFYEAIEAIPGVDHVNIEEFRSQAEGEDKETSLKKNELTEHGKIEPGSNQIAVIPGDAPYDRGLWVKFEGED
jgi:uncharacterized phage protein gp47/JayE